MSERYIDCAIGETGKLPIKEFSMRNIYPNSAMIIIAKRGSGKSWVVRAIIERFKDFPCGIVISPTEDVDPFYSKFFPESYIYTTYKPETIQKIFTRQKKLKDKERRTGKKLDKRILIVMDDCLAIKSSWNKDPNIDILLMNGRHYEITFILTMQYALGISPTLRSNFDYIIALADDIQNNIERLYKNYAGIFPNLDSFKQVFQQLTEDYGAMIIANRGVKSNILEKVFWYKAPNLDNSSFIFGGRQFKLYHEKNFNKDWQSNEDGIDVNKFILQKKKNKSVLAIAKLKR
jgi:hypothetical protein